MIVPVTITWMTIISTTVEGVGNVIETLGTFWEYSGVSGSDSMFYLTII